MNTLIIGIARTGQANNFVLNEDTPYISMCGAKPEISFRMSFGQDAFLEMMNELRYKDADPSSANTAINFFQEHTTELFKKFKYVDLKKEDASPLHIRLVTTPLELAQIPFEFALTPAAGEETQSLFANPGRPIILTREIRRENDLTYTWPYKPRILFAWAAPAGSTVPHDEHYAALKAVVAPLAPPRKDIADPEPDTDNLLTELPNASVEAIKAAINKASEDNKPYTHINILAHGGADFKNGVLQFRLLLCRHNSNDAKKTEGEVLAAALIPEKKENTPAIVSLMACDGGNTGNTIFPSGSLVYQLHKQGIPCAYASQFPLTQPGSVIAVKKLYEQLLNGCDPRIALYEARLALKKEPYHDWASLIAYARFPENINEQLKTTKLKMAFGSMKTTTAWVDHVLKQLDTITPEKKESIFATLEEKLDNSIKELSDFFAETGNDKILSDTKDLVENQGLLGSAYKRKAEYLFKLASIKTENEKELKALSLEALKQSANAYYRGFDANPASHWNAMQHLSLAAILDIAVDKDIWIVVKFMALKEEQNADEYNKVWSWGTLAELFMLYPALAPNAAPEDTTAAREMAKKYIMLMADKDAGYNQHKESTARQLERYINWFPQIITSATVQQLKQSALELRALLPPLEALI